MNDVVSERGGASGSNAGGGSEKLKLWVAALLLVGGLVLFYVLSGRPLVYRWAAMVAGLVLAVAVFATTELGRFTWRFVLDSQIELRKVVWPTREETWKRTWLVFGFVGIAGLFFWVLDLMLAGLTKWMTGGAGG